MSTIWKLVVLPLVFSLGAGCIPLGTEENGSQSSSKPASGNGAGDTGSTSIATGAGACESSASYDSVEKGLAARSMNFLGAQDGYLQAVGNRLYWYDTTNYAPILHGYTDGGSELAYSFSVGDSVDDANWTASSDLIVTAQPTESGVAYYAYDPNYASKRIGVLNVAAPNDASYWAYAVDANNVYLVMTDDNGNNALVRWVPADGSTTTTVTTLESAGATIGEFWAFGVSGNTMVFVESGALWTLNIAENTATSLMNTVQVDPNGVIDFESDGVMFTTTDGGLWFFPYATNKLVNVSQEIDQKMYPSGPCSMGASAYSTDFARYGNTVVYVGSDTGVFAFDMAADVIAPVLLPPESGSVTIQYRYPVVLTDGSLFVTALTSNDGTTGAEGPVVRLDLANLIQ
jgi:hypothetical protein